MQVTTETWSNCISAGVFTILLLAQSILKYQEHESVAVEVIGRQSLTSSCLMSCVGVIFSKRALLSVFGEYQ